MTLNDDGLIHEIAADAGAFADIAELLRQLLSLFRDAGAYALQCRTPAGAFSGELRNESRAHVSSAERLLARRTDEFECGWLPAAHVNDASGLLVRGFECAPFLPRRL